MKEHLTPEEKDIMDKARAEFSSMVEAAVNILCDKYSIHMLVDSNISIAICNHEPKCHGAKAATTVVPGSIESAVAALGIVGDLLLDRIREDVENFKDIDSGENVEEKINNVKNSKSDYPREN